MGTKAEMQLLAYERNDKSWNAVSNEEPIRADEVNDFSDGTLILVNLSSSRQIQGSPELASNRIVGILQNFSRLLDKNKSKDDDIEQWRQSLSIQAEELQRQRQDVETRLADLAGADEELRHLAQQREELTNLKAETNNLIQEFEQKQAELNNAWEQLREEQRNLESLQQNNSSEDFNPFSAEASNQLSAAVSQNTEQLQERIGTALIHVQQQQDHLQSFWDNLEQDRQILQGLQSEMDKLSEVLQWQTNDLRDRAQSVENAQIQLQVQQELFNTKQSTLHNLQLSLQNQTELQEMLHNLALGIGNQPSESSVDIGALEAMPLGELENIVNQLKADLDKLVRFVNDQEEELTIQREAVEAIQQKISSTTGSNVMQLQELETELKDEQDCMKMLNETLVGQRRTLGEHAATFRQHLKILKQRQGVIEVDTAIDIDLNPVISRLEQFQQEQSEQQQKLSQEIAQYQSSLQQLQEVLTSQEYDMQQQQAAFEQNQEEYQQKQEERAKLASRVEFCETQLQPIQNNLDGIAQPLRELEQLVNQFVNVLSPSDA